MVDRKILAKVRSMLRVEALIALASDLIRIPSVTPKDAADCERVGVMPGEGELTETIADRLHKSGLEVTMQEVIPGRPSLIARLRGSGNGPVLCFNGHLDTVGAFEMGQQAFQPEVRGGRLYGRGAADAKGALACSMLVLETLAKREIELPGDLVLTAVIGEEGPPSGTEFLLRSGFEADGVIVGEPSEGRLFVGQRGGQFVRLITKGKTAHGSIPHAGVNAIESMSRLLVSIPKMPLFSQVMGAYGPPSFCVGTIKGGVRTNVVPDRCECTIDVRMPPGVSPEDVLSSFRTRMDALGIEGFVEPEEEGHPAYLTPEDAWLSRTAVQAAKELDLDSNLGLAPYWSDMAFLHQAGLPTLIIGPGSTLQAHSADEYVQIGDLITCAQLYMSIALIFCKGPKS